MKTPKWVIGFFVVLAVAALVSGALFLSFVNGVEKARIEIQAEQVKFENQLKDRIMKAIPLADPVKIPKPDEFFLTRIGQMNELSAEVTLVESATDMTCRGVVYFKSTKGRHFDELYVSDCRASRQPTRVFSSGIRQKQME